MLLLILYMRIFMNYKKLKLKELKQIFSDYKFKRTPYWHQYVTLAFGLNRKRLMLWHDIGIGKTLTSLLLMQIWGVKKILVVSPNSVSDTWEKETKKGSNYKIHLLTGTTKEREELLSLNRKGIYWINYEGLKYLFADLTPKRGFVINLNIIYELKKMGFEGFIIDEIHKCRHWSAIQTKIGFHISRNMKYVLGLTGTPVARSEIDLWAEYFVLDSGKSLGKNFWRFTRMHFNKVPFSSPPFELKSKHERIRILQKVRNETIRFSRSECYQIKEPVFEARKVNFTKQQKAAYYDLIENWSLRLGETQITLKNAMTLGGKLRQISTGFIYDQEHNPIDIKCNKYDELISCLEEIKDSVLIYYSFKRERDLIAARLKKEGIKFSTLQGRMKKVDYNNEKQKFLNKKTKVILIHPETGGEGLDGLQYVSSTAIFFSNINSGAIIRQQCQGRVDRNGQKNPCLFIDIYVKDSIEQTIINNGYDSMKVAQTIMAWMEK